MALGSTFAGIAIGNAGCTAPHGIEHPISGLLNRARRRACRHLPGIHAVHAPPRASGFASWPASGRGDFRPYGRGSLAARRRAGGRPSETLGIAFTVRFGCKASSTGCPARHWTVCQLAPTILRR
ncbi:MAG: hypothetical protein ACLRWP_17600 [Bilophila wadsworthia]